MSSDGLQVSAWLQASNVRGNDTGSQASTQLVDLNGDLTQDFSPNTATWPAQSEAPTRWGTFDANGGDIIVHVAYSYHNLTTTGGAIDQAICYVSDYAVGGDKTKLEVVCTNSPGNSDGVKRAYFNITAFQLKPMSMSAGDFAPIDHDHDPHQNVDCSAVGADCRTTISELESADALDSTDEFIISKNIGGQYSSKKTNLSALIDKIGSVGITIKEEGATLIDNATSLNFVGSTVTASGTGAEKTITITEPAGGGGTSSGGGGSQSTPVQNIIASGHGEGSTDTLFDITTKGGNASDKWGIFTVDISNNSTSYNVGTRHSVYVYRGPGFIADSNMVVSMRCEDADDYCLQFLAPVDSEGKCYIKNHHLPGGGDHSWTLRYMGSI